jgi:hypothetical protein
MTIRTRKFSEPSFWCCWSWYGRYNDQRRGWPIQLHDDLYVVAARWVLPAMPMSADVTPDRAA